MMFFKKALKKRTCIAFSALVFLPYFFTVFYKGGIGLLAHLVLFLGIGLAGLLFFYSLRKKIYKERDLPFYENIFLLLTVVLFSLSYVYSMTKNVGLLELGSLYSGVILIFVGYNLAKDKAHLNRLFTVITWSVFASLIIGFIAYFGGAFERFAGSFNNFFEPWSAFPNAFGDFLLLSTPVIFYLVEQKKKKAKNILKFLPDVTFVLAVCGMLLTDSEGIKIAAVMLFSVMFVRLLITGKFAKQFIILVMIGTVLAYGAAGIKEATDIDYREGIMSTDQGITPEVFEDRNSISTRLEHFKIGAKLSLETPLFGFGPGSYPYVSAGELSLLNTATHPHNLFLKIAVENGPLTLLAFAGLIGTVMLRSLLMFFRKFDPARELVFLGILAFLVHQMIDYNLNFASVSFLFFILLGTLIAERVRRGKRFHIKEFRYANHFMVTALSLVLVLFSLGEGFLRAYDGSPILKRAHYENIAADQIYAGENAYKTIQKGLRANPYNDSLYALNGHYKEAYELNPHNLMHLIGLYESASPAYREVLDGEIEEVLDEYLSLLSVNANFTILTDNPLAAFSLAKLIGDNDLADTLKEIRLHEEAKFSNLYNVSF